jgi:hypothetical protein
MKSRRILQFTGLIIVIVALYDGSIFYSRWSSNRAIERARADKEVEEARKTVALLGGDTFKITSFYVSPPVIKPGESANICYSVNGAKTLKLDPPVADVYPAITRCFAVSPRKETEYKLTADDGAGHSASESFVLKVTK